MLITQPADSIRFFRHFSFICCTTSVRLSVSSASFCAPTKWEISSSVWLIIADRNNGIDIINIYLAVSMSCIKVKCHSRVGEEIEFLPHAPNTSPTRARMIRRGNAREMPAICRTLAKQRAFGSLRRRHRHRCGVVFASALLSAFDVYEKFWTLYSETWNSNQQTKL